RRTAPFEGANAGAIPTPAASFSKSSFDSPDGEIGSCLSYKEMLRVQFLLGRPLPRCIIRSAPVSDTRGLEQNRARQPISLAVRKHQQRTNTSVARSAVAVCKHCMNDILNKTIVLVLNRNWQAINIRTPQEAFCQMATNVATALE